MTIDTIEQTLSVPPVYRTIAIATGDDPVPAACQMAADGADPATLLWSLRNDRVDCAVVLGPEKPLAESLLVSYVMSNATGDALGVLLPPIVAVTFGWPDRIVVNGAIAGGIRVVAASTESAQDVPAWMVAGLTLALQPESDDAPGLDPDRTTLRDEGCAEVETSHIIESFSRHLLYWMDRWEEEGFGPVKDSWLARAANYGSNEAMERGGAWSKRKLLWLDADGGAEYAEDGAETTTTLADALQRPSWSL
jgi:BirA family biotin operon repressor/biotin-[acetyl-CoA-carboxylase] ligase